MVRVGDIDKIHLLGMVFSLFVLTSVGLLVRGRLLKEKYALVWLLIGAFILVMSVFDNLMDWFSALIGVDYAPSALFAILIACAYLLLLNVSVAISDLKRHNKALTQELGLTRLRLEELEKKVNRLER
ncbi:MAG TPA: DUF2304 domain-containing protein [Patescibacteria group bacterium]|nr:DUF2304 domain-containing protein [Patescibacteria group bacterium]